MATRTDSVGQRLTKTTFGNTLVETRAYRSDGSGKDNLLTSLSIPSVTSFSYSFDANKNKTTETDNILNPYSWSTGGTGYDDKDRLTNWSRANGDSQAWSLSLVGDWANTVVNGTTDTRTHNAVHELATRTAATNPLTYDLKGNLTFDGNTNAYAYDFDNKLNWADTNHDGVPDITYAYDALGRRISKTVAATSVTTIYLSALNQEITEYAAGSLVKKYVYGTYVDEPLAMLNISGVSENTYYYHANSLYCIAAMTDSTGAVQERYVYTPYGQRVILDPAGTTIRAASAIGNGRGHQGLRHDEESGLVYVRHRYDDLALGRWMSRDPIGDPSTGEWATGRDLKGAAVKSAKRKLARMLGRRSRPAQSLLEYADGMNLYQYVRSDPVRGLDPSGLDVGGIDPQPYTFPFPQPWDDLPANSPDCNKYGCSERYDGANARCFCKCAGDSQWSQYVRGCLQYLYGQKYDPGQAHSLCYKWADELEMDRPTATLGYCYAKCLTAGNIFSY